MKKQPLKYRLNILGASVIIFLLIRTYGVPLITKLVSGKGTALLLVCYIFLVALSCLLPVAFIENMCEFHPFLFGKGDITHAPAIVMSSMTLFIFAAVANRAILIPLEKMGVAFPPQTMPRLDGPGSTFLYFIFAAVCPAVFEELYIRGIALNLLLPYGKRFAVIATSLIFMTMHTGVQSYLPVFVAGVTFACAYLYTDSIYVPMAIHFANNTYSFLVMNMEQSVNGISSVAFTITLIAGIFLFGLRAVIELSKNKVNIYSVYTEDKKPAAAGRMLTSPVLILRILACLMAALSQVYAVVAG